MPGLHLLIPQPNHYYNNEHHKLHCNDLLHFPVQVDPLMMLFGMGGAGFNFGEKAHRLVAVPSFFWGPSIFCLLPLAHAYHCITAALIFCSPSFSLSSRDVFLQGTCDDGVKELAKRLGWEVRQTVHVSTFMCLLPCLSFQCTHTHAERTDGFV